MRHDGKLSFTHVSSPYIIQYSNTVYAIGMEVDCGRGSCINHPKFIFRNHSQPLDSMNQHNQTKMCLPNDPEFYQ